MVMMVCMVCCVKYIGECGWIFSLCILVSWKKYRFNPFCSDTYPNLSLMDFLLTLVPDIFVSLLTCLFYCKGTFCKSISCMIELNRTKLYEIANQARCFAKVSFERDESLKVKKSRGNEWWFIVNTDYRDLIMSRLKAEAVCHPAFKSSSKSHRSLDLRHPGIDLWHSLLPWVPESAHQRRETL